ncbi:MAG: hypothetical protein LBJ26_06320 [Paenibacillus sp.]|nr:hypothetical protein [Paenibacillus sp.]
MHKISRQKTVEGTRIPGIIHNMQYFYNNLDVYEDGMMNCWELVDLEGLKEKLRTGWLVTSIPDGEDISIHGLGNYEIITGSWNYDKDSYYEYIKETIERLNPNLNNIYTISEEEKKLLEQRRIFYSPDAKDFYVKSESFYQTVEGNGFTIFMKHEDCCYLANLVVYKDGRVKCFYSGREIDYEIEEVQEMFRAGTFFTEFKTPTKVILDDFAEVTLGESIYCADPEEKYKELLDIHLKLNGNKTSLEKCRAAYYSYLEDPSDDAREELKELYELIPEHERMYLGDMDSKDGDYRRIIYRPEDKREV